MEPPITDSVVRRQLTAVVHTLVYPKHLVKPEDLLNFVELDWFVNHWEDLALDDEALAALQILIMCNPRAGDVVPGTGGLRKMRFSPPGSERGKRGGLRVCYVYYEKYGIVLLLIVYAKSEQDDLSPKEKRIVKGIIARVEKQLKKRFGF